MQQSSLPDAITALRVEGNIFVILSAGPGTTRQVGPANSISEPAGCPFPVIEAVLGSEADMAILDWSQCPAVESDPDKLGGAWVLRGTRMPVAAIFENIDDGLSIAEVMEHFDVTRDEIKSVLEFAAGA